MALVSTVLAYAVEEGYRADNPARGIRGPAYSQRRHRLDERQYLTLGTALVEAEANGASWQAIAAIRLIALTGCRRSEITRLRKVEIDLKACVMRLGDTKTGASLRPIGEAAAAIILEAQRRSNSAYLLPGMRGADAPYAGLPKAWSRMVTPKLPGVTAHDATPLIRERVRRPRLQRSDDRRDARACWQRDDARVHPQARPCACRRGRSRVDAHPRCDASG